MWIKIIKNKFSIPAEFILQPFRHFTYVTAHSETLPSLYLRQSSFSKPSFAFRTSQALHLRHSTSFPSLHLRHSSFSNPYVPLPTSQLILLTFRCFTYLTAHFPTLLSLFLRHLCHSPTFPSLHLCHSSFWNPSVAFTCVTAHSPTLPLLHLRHRSFSNPSFASPTSQAFHVRHLASRPWIVNVNNQK